MKEIGEALKEARENMKLEIDEVANDLKLRPSQIRNIEEGNTDSFTDMLSLKSFIKEYSKYLGLDYEEMVDEFNEYLFDSTSKVSLEDIKKARDAIRKEKKEENKISSPYTKEVNKNYGLRIAIISLLVLAVIGVILFFIIKNKDNNINDETITFIERSSNIL